MIDIAVSCRSVAISGKPRGRKRDLLGEWRSHHQIDERQFQAGQRFVRLIERADMHGHASIDLGMVRVDRSPCGTAAAARVAMAKAEMIELRQILGVTDFALACRVIGEGHDLSGAVVADGAASVDTHAGGDARRRYLAARIRDALALLAARFAMEGEMV